MKKFSLWLMALLVIGFLAGCSEEAKEPEKETTEDGKTVIKVAFKDEGPSNPVAVQYYEKLAEDLKKAKDLDVQFELVEVAQGY